MDPLLFLAYALVVLCNFTKPMYGANLLPFGPENPNEQSVVVNDFDIVTVPLDINLPFFGTTYSTAYLIDAGRISFVHDGDHFADPFPYNRPIIAPLWSDQLDTTEPLYWRQTTIDTSDLVAATTYVRKFYPNFSTFQATWTMVVTWYKFRQFGGSLIPTPEEGEYRKLQLKMPMKCHNQITQPTQANKGTRKDNTFQAILATDGTLSFAIFLYQDITELITTTIGVNAGDNINYYWLCISGTNTVLNVEQHTMSLCGSDYGIVVFRMDANNPDPGNYICTPTYEDADCVEKSSYYCKENAMDPTLIDVVTTVQRSGLLSMMAWDTQKYEDGVDPDPLDSDCETPAGASIPMTLIFTVDVDAAMSKCGVRITGTTVKTLEITIRSYVDDKRFDLEDDRVHIFTCTTDTLLPYTVVQTKFFSDIQTTHIPQVSRTAELQVIVPGTSQVVNEVEMGQAISLRIVYDNTAQNIPPYGVYVIKCSIADTMPFDEDVIDIIDDGCVVEQDPTKIWYISRTFRQTSLVGGLFITDSGVMSAAKFINKDKIFLRCLIDWCFFHTVTPNLCDDSCDGTGDVRRKRSENQTSSVPEILYTRLKVRQPKELRPEEDKELGCLKDTVVYITLSTVAFALFLALTVTVILFFRVYF